MRPPSVGGVRRVPPSSIAQRLARGHVASRRRWRSAGSWAFRVKPSLGQVVGYIQEGPVVTLVGRFKGRKASIYRLVTGAAGRR